VPAQIIARAWALGPYGSTPLKGINAPHRSHSYWYIGYTVGIHNREVCTPG